jgi:Zn-dependent protease
VQALDLSGFLYKVSIWTIPVLFAITLHEVAHGWMARCFGDRTAEMLGRLSLNPLRHIDPIGTVLVPGILLAIGGPLVGWAKPVPVATKVLRNPRWSVTLVALAGPLANFAMAIVWCLVFAAVVHVRGDETVAGWIVRMADAGIVVNVILGLFNMLPVPPLDGGRVLTGFLPAEWGARIEKFEPFGLVLALGLSTLGLLGWLFNPALRAMGRVINALIGAQA